MNTNIKSIVLFDVEQISIGKYNLNKNTYIFKSSSLNTYAFKFCENTL